jgi:hypothetical protein
MLVRPEIDYSGHQSVFNVNSSCTEVCNSYSGKSCAKILQVNAFQKDNPSETHKMYAIIFVQLVELEFHLYYLECGHILSTLVDSSECHDVPTQSAS